MSAADFAVTDGLHLAEIDGPLLTICRASDGKALNFHGRAFCKAFRDSVAYAGPARADRARNGRGGLSNGLHSPHR